MTSSKTSAWVSSYLDSKRGANMAVAIKPTEQKQNWGRSDGKAAGKAGGGEHVAAAAGKVSGGSKNEVWLKTPVKDGCFEKNPKTAMRVDKGDSTTFSRYGDYKYGRTIGDGRELQASPGRRDVPPAFSRFMRMPRTHVPIGGKGGFRVSAYGDRPVQDLEPDAQPGEIEILCGFPRFLPPGVASVYLAAQSDDGAQDTSDRMHVRKGVGWSGSDGHLGGALVLQCNAARRVSLHLMAESHGQPPRSMGSFNIALPAVTRARRRRLRLTAPLDMPVELVWSTTPKNWARNDFFERGYEYADEDELHAYEPAAPPRPGTGQYRYGAGHGRQEWKDSLRPPVSQREARFGPPSPMHGIPRRIVDAFRYFDRNDSGYLDYRELRNAIQYMGFDCTTGGAKEVVMRYDDRPDGKLDVNEFAELIRDVESGVVRADSRHGGGHYRDPMQYPVGGMARDDPLRYPAYLSPAGGRERLSPYNPTRRDDHSLSPRQLLTPRSQHGVGQWAADAEYDPWEMEAGPAPTPRFLDPYVAERGTNFLDRGGVDVDMDPPWGAAVGRWEPTEAPATRPFSPAFTPARSPIRAWGPDRVVGSVYA